MLMNDVTRILNEPAQGNPHPAENLVPMAYDEMRRRLMANQIVITVGIFEMGRALHSD